MLRVKLPAMATKPAFRGSVGLRMLHPAMPQGDHVAIILEANAAMHAMASKPVTVGES